MSLKSEIKRLSDAKQSLKESIKNRGVEVEDTDTLDVFADLLKSAPFTIKGTFTPEEDTSVFEVSGLEFAPVTLSVVCEELVNTAVANSVVCEYIFKENSGLLMYYSSTAERRYASVGSASTTVEFTQNSVKTTIPNQNCFKKGYTYTYIVSGGFRS